MSWYPGTQSHERSTHCCWAAQEHGYSPPVMGDCVARMTHFGLGLTRMVILSTTNARSGATRRPFLFPLCRIPTSDLLRAALFISICSLRRWEHEELRDCIFDSSAAMDGLLVLGTMWSACGGSTVVENRSAFSRLRRWILEIGYRC